MCQCVCDCSGFKVMIKNAGMLIQICHGWDIWWNSGHCARGGRVGTSTLWKQALASHVVSPCHCISSHLQSPRDKLMCILATCKVITNLLAARKYGAGTEGTLCCSTSVFEYDHS